jgi:two-component system, NtrC family, sensor kinase
VCGSYRVSCKAPDQSLPDPAPAGGVIAGGAWPALCTIGRKKFLGRFEIRDMDLMEKVRRAPRDYRIIAAVFISAILVVAIGIIISLWATREISNVITRQFNSQQLVVARNIRSLVERELSLIRRELVLLAQSLRQHGEHSGIVPDITRESLKRVVENGVRKIEIVDLRAGTQVVYLPYQAVAMVDMAPDELAQIQKGFQGDDPAVWISDPIIADAELILKMAVPVTADKNRILLFHINVGWFLGAFIKDIRSGTSGYAWIIDSRGTFLHHPFAPYIGANAFEIRAVFFKQHSFSSINRIQRESMLKGEEGFGEYTSVWHRGMTGEIQKLIAYTPIRISNVPSQIWSVAVVAPISEIHESVRSLQLWQLLLQGLMICIVVAGAGAIIFFEVRWSKNLENKVLARTEALKRSEEKYRSLVESAEDFIFTLDAEKKFISVNSYTAAFFGSTTEALALQSIGSFFPEGAAKKIARCVDMVFHNRRSIRQELELKSGHHQVWISVNCMPLRDEQAGMCAVLCIARDISEHKKLEKQLINTEKLASLGTLAAGVAHELNNPLGVILGFCDLLIRTKEVGAQEYADLKIIEGQGLHCKQIVENLLSFARVGHESESVSDLNQCLEETIAIVRYSLEMQRIILDLDLAPNLPVVRGDGRQLQQVFLNLINNAAAAMKGGGRLWIRTVYERNKRRACVQLQDDGEGIRPEDIDRIYDPFFTTKPEGEGTGLGLFISYGIIKKYGGSIECKSTYRESSGSPGGTTFSIKLMTQ